MNQPQARPADYSAASLADDEIDLKELLYTLLDHKKTIIAFTLVALALGWLYATLATPIYESNVLIQVEDGAGGVGQKILGGDAGLFDIKTDATAEMEILRSRMIAAHAVDELGLNISASARYFPLVGKGIARLRGGLSEGRGGYAWGGERIRIGQFVLPESHIGQNFTITVLGEGRYRLQEVGHEAHSAEGEVGQDLALPFLNDGGAYHLRVDGLSAKPGIVFDVVAGSRLAHIQRLQSSLQIREQGRASGLISVALKGSSPSRIAAVLNSVAAAHLRQNIERKTEEAENSLKFLDGLLPDLKAELENNESHYNEYRNTRGIVNLGDESKSLLSESSAAQTRLLELKQRRQELSARYTAEHPNMQAISGMMAQAQGELDRVNAEIRRLPMLEQDTLRLTRDLKVSTDLYASLQQTAQQLRLARASKVGTVRLIDPAFVPERPIAPKKAAIIMLAALAGAALGVALVLLRQALSGSIESSEAVEQLTGLPVYANIPHSARQREATAKQAGSSRLELLASVANTDLAVESLRSFYTAMQFASLSARNNITLITGPTQAVGKSFVSANYAAILAQAGKRVLLIDGDIRKGYLHKYFGLQQGPGFSEVLAGTAKLEDALHKQVLPQLDFIACGQFPPNPTELLRSAGLAELLQAQSAAYDIVLIDAAPVLPVTDPLILAAHVGSTVVILREGRSTEDDVQEILKRSQQAGVAITGFLLNDLQQNKSKYKYRYGYSYGYGNGYGYAYGQNETPVKRSAWAKLMRRLLK